MRKLVSKILTLTLMTGLLFGCSNKVQIDDSDSNDQTIADSNDNSNNIIKDLDIDFSKTDTEMFTTRDSETDYNKNTAVKISLNDNSSTATSDSVNIVDSTITITEEATYLISGTLSNGMIIINAKDTSKIHLVFDGVNITSKSSAALYILKADKVFITFVDGTSNSLSNEGNFIAIDDNNIDGALFSKQDLTLNGSGNLSISSPAGHGIVCKDDLVITGGSYDIKSAFHGLDANDSVRISNATLNIAAGKDGIHCENSDDETKGFIYISSGNINAKAEGDGITASYYVQIENGTIDLSVGGGSENATKKYSDSFGGFMGRNPGSSNSQNEQNIISEEGTSMKGIKSANSLLISDGNITINSADDSIHSDNSILINGGTFTITSGDDAIHAEDTLTITLGNIDITDSYEGLEALHIEIQGGNINLVASDDGLNAAGGMDESGFTGGRDGMFDKRTLGGISSNSNGSIKISDGKLYINSSGDGIDANGTLEISGGHTTIVGPTHGDTATLDFDKTAIISGGTFIGTGASTMAQTFSDSDQGVIAISVGNQIAGTSIVLKDSDDNIIISYQPELDFAVVILSSSEIKKGETYTISIGSRTGEVEAN